MSTSKSPLHSGAAGMISGLSSALLFQPFDVLKTKVQIESAKNVQNRPSLRMVFLNTVDQGRHLSALWRGLTPSVARLVPGAGLYFMSLSCISSFSVRYWPSRAESRTVKFLEGGIARLGTDLVLLPFTVLKTRYESGQFAYRSLPAAFAVTYRNEGIRGLYIGLTPTLIRDVPFSGLYLSIYTSLKTALGCRDQGSSDLNTNASVESRLSTLQLFTCASISGIIASLITQPFDVVKTHMQLKTAEFKHLQDCIRWVYHNQGARGFLSGAIPRCARRTLMTAVAWTLYERIMIAVGIQHKAL